MKTHLLFGKYIIVMKWEQFKYKWLKINLRKSLESFNPFLNYSFKRCLLRTYYVTETILALGDRKVNKTDIF